VNDVTLNSAGAPKALLDASGTDIIATVGEPFRIRIPFKGSPLPTVTWFNVCCFFIFRLLVLKLFKLQSAREEVVIFTKYLCKH